MTRQAMQDWLRKRAFLSPHSLALKCGGASLTWSELDARAGALAGSLLREGVEPGDRVAVLMPNSAELVELVHAVPRAGAILVPLNARLSAEEIAWQVADSGSRLLVLAPSMTAEGESAVRECGIEALTVDELRDRSGSPLQPHDFDLDSVHSIIYTSGTTGRPKGAMLTFGNHFWSAMGSALNLGISPDDRWLACLPLFHVGGLAILLRAVLYGNAVVVHETFDADRVNQDLDAEEITLVSVVSTMLARVLDSRGPRPFPKGLRAALLGGGPAPRPLLEECAGRGVPVLQTYGLTECASQVATLAPSEALSWLGSAGKPLFPTDLRVVTLSGETAASGVAGEIAVRGPTVTPGYWNRPDATAAAIVDGWLYTGDWGYQDEDGYLYVLDRRDDLIISGGENVYPAEVESVLAGHPGVAEAGVFSLPDRVWGHRPAAVVVCREGVDVTPDDLQGYCRERLAAYKVPVLIRFAPSLPRTAAGKLQRYLLPGLCQPS